MGRAPAHWSRNRRGAVPQATICQCLEPRKFISVLLRLPPPAKTTYMHLHAYCICDDGPRGGPVFDALNARSRSLRISSLNSRTCCARASRCVIPPEDTVDGGSMDGPGSVLYAVVLAGHLHDGAAVPSLPFWGSRRGACTWCGAPFECLNSKKGSITGPFLLLSKLSLLVDSGCRRRN